MVPVGDPDPATAAHRSGGPGGSGTDVKGDFTDLLRPRGLRSMRRSQDPISASSQFFIVVADAPHLDNQYSAFGKVSEGLDAVDKIVAEETDHRDNPVEPVAITVKIVEE